MSKIADFIVDFLTIVEDNPKYTDNDWNWDNLPTFEIMWEIVNKNREEKK